MLTDRDFMGFFDSIMQLEVYQRDYYKELSGIVGDPELQETMLRISAEEQTHIDYVQSMIDLVNRSA